MRCFSIVLVTASISLSAGEVDPRYAVNITLYHVNPREAGAIPVNMDLGDPAGDLFFYLTQFLLPLECSADPMDRLSKFDCSNPEQTSPKLVVTKVNLVVDSRFTGYKACNFCNGTDPITRRPCKEGSYVCSVCFENPFKRNSCNENYVGKLSISSSKVSGPTCGKTLQTACGKYVGHSPLRCLACLAWNHREISENNCTAMSTFSFCNTMVSRPCGEGARDFECWRENIGRKTGGFWYSTTEAGMCQAASPQQSCAWKVVSTSTVQEQCMRKSIISMAEAASPDCFVACGPRNTTSTCWIDCFFTALLGPQAETSTKVEGIPLETLTESWTHPFLPESQGGCPKVSDMQVFATQSSQPAKQLPGWLQHKNLELALELEESSTTSFATITV